MRRTEILQEIRAMRFEELYVGCSSRRLTRREAALVLGVSERTFRRYVDRYEDFGMEGLSDKRLTRASFRRAPVDEVAAISEVYRSRYRGWNARHFYSWYRRDGGKRSYSWVKNTLQSRGLVPKAKKRGVHRKQRDRAPVPGMMLHQDGSNHEWVPGKRRDLIVTMDDATSEHYSMFFVDEEGTAGSFRGVREVIVLRGLFSSLYTDRGSRYWFTPEEGEKVGKTQLTRFGRAMQQLGIQMIAAYSPEARGRSERAFQTHQGRLVKELALHGIATIDAANRYLREVYMPAFNEEFVQEAPEEGTAFIPWEGADIDDILCEQHERTVSADNCASFDGMKLQIPADRYRCHCVKVRVRLHRYPNGHPAIFHGPRKLADYDPRGKLTTKKAA